MTKQSDDLEAVRILVQALEPFENTERQRIIRWASEKLGMSVEFRGSPDRHFQSVPDIPKSRKGTDIRSFIDDKNPKSENQMAAVVADYYRFEAPEEERKESINKDILVDACRRGNRARPKNPGQVLVNTFNNGWLDRVGEKGEYRISSVGENLVAMVLPEGSLPGVSVTRQKKDAQASKKKRVRRKLRAPKEKPKKRAKAR
jgi:hypothetical protein